MISIILDTSQVDKRLTALSKELRIGHAAIQNGATEALKLIRTHLAGLAQSRHTTATKLGATPTGHLRAQAATISDTSPHSATISIAIPGIARARRDITIRPREKQALTIPVHALAYGKTVAILSRTLKIFKPKGKDYLATVKEGQLIVLYLLRKSVTQRHDPTLLPTDPQLQAAFVGGYTDALKIISGATHE